MMSFKESRQVDGVMVPRCLSVEHTQNGTKVTRGLTFLGCLPEAYVNHMYMDTQVT